MITGFTRLNIYILHRFSNLLKKLYHPFVIKNIIRFILSVFWIPTLAGLSRQFFISLLANDIILLIIFSLFVFPGQLSY